MFGYLSMLILATIVTGKGVPSQFVGPTANLKSITNDTVALLNDSSSWPTVLSHVTSSGGAFHIRAHIFDSMTDSQQVMVANNAQELNLRISIEAGGYMCRPSGAKNAQNQIAKLQPFLQAGGKIHFWGLESVFSRTRGGCANFTLTDTVREVAAYAGVVAAALPATEIYLYDALPHYSVGKAWPPNQPLKPGQWAMDLPEVLSLLAPAMAAQGAHLVGYWADCPYEYSINYPDGNGYQRLAAAVSSVKATSLKFGKTFNSEGGGKTSDELFYNLTLDDFSRSTQAVPLSSFDMIMVETWYTHPTHPAPETLQYTTMYTAKAVMEQIHV